MAAVKSLVLLSPPAARAVRRRRRFRPSHRWELDAANGCENAACAAFLDALEAWPRDAWLALARRAEGAEGTDGDGSAAAARALDAVVAERALAVTAWLLRDLVATAAATACADADPIAPARRAAERAALARLLRRWLHRGDYLALTEPFRRR